MNNNGQVLFYSFMIGITILILALALAPAVNEQVITTMNPTNLDCANSSISNFDRATCQVTDLSKFHFVGGLIFVAGAVLVSRIVFQ